MKKLLLAALSALACASVCAPAISQVATAYQDTVSNRVVTVPVTPTNKLPVTATLSGTSDVNLTQTAGVAVAKGHGTAATALRVELPTDGTGVVGLAAGTTTAVTNAGTFATQSTLQAGSAIAGKFGIDQTTPGTTNGVQVNAALPAGTALIGKVGIDQTTPGTTNKVSIGTDGTVAATQSGTWNVTNLSGTVSLPTGASTAANQTSVQSPTTPASATATKSQLAGCTYTAAGVTFTDGQQGALSCGASGGLYVSGGIASGVADSGNPVKVGAKYNTTLPTLTDGQRGDMQIGTRGSLNVTLMATDSVSPLSSGTLSDGLTAPSNNLSVRTLAELFNGSNYDRVRTIQGASTVTTGIGVTAVAEAPAPFSHISTNTTTTVKSGAGELHSICISTKGASSNVATVYDNTAGSGTVVAVLDTTSNVGCLTYNLGFATGLTIVTATGTAPDMTISYR